MHSENRHHKIFPGETDSRHWSDDRPAPFHPLRRSDRPASRKPPRRFPGERAGREP